MHVSVGSIGEHEQLRAFFIPEDGRRRVSARGATKLDDSVKADLLIAGQLGKDGRCWKGKGKKGYKTTNGSLEHIARVITYSDTIRR